MTRYSNGDPVNPPTRLEADLDEVPPGEECEVVDLAEWRRAHGYPEPADPWAEVAP